MLNIDEGPRAGGAITNLAGATLDVPDDVVFSQNSVVRCFSRIHLVDRFEFKYSATNRVGSAFFSRRLSSAAQRI